MPARPESDRFVFPTLQQSDVDKLHAATRSEYKTRFEQAALAYQGVRERTKGQSPNSQIISSFGLTGSPYNFTWQHLTPANGGWRPYPGVRPWRLVAFHSFGDTMDGAILAKNKRLLFPPDIDEHGHSPKKWAVGQRVFFFYREVLPPPNRSVGIHFLVSRRGDVIASAGLNDVAYHLGGTRLIVGGRNDSSVGFELELLLYRKKPGGALLFHPYSKRQLIALAVILKKMEAVRPIPRKHISEGTPDSPAIDETTSGYVLHSEISYKRSDPGAQFNIPAGQPGSGWDELFGYMGKVRQFNLSTEVFVTSLSPEDTKSVQALAGAFALANAGSKTALRAIWAQSTAMRRAMRLYNQTRVTRSGSALAQASTINDRITASTTSILRVVQGFSPSSLPVMVGAQVFNEENNEWETT